MKCLSATIILTLAALVHCEPPVPQGQYLPPSSTYGAPSVPQAPSSSYGAPRGGSFGGSGGGGHGGHGGGGGGGRVPSSSYGTPSNSYGPPSNSYGAPAVTSAIFSKPQSTYGAPTQQAGYGGGATRGGGYDGGNGYGGGSGYGEENYGPAKYEFQYDVQDYQSGQDFGHMESRDGDRAVGRYYVLLPDGRKQIVTYEADEHGYRPTISYEQTAGGGGSGGGGYGGGYDSNAQSKFNGY